MNAMQNEISRKKKKLKKGWRRKLLLIDLAGFYQIQTMALTSFQPRWIVDPSHAQPSSKQSDKTHRS